MLEFVIVLGAAALVSILAVWLYSRNKEQVQEFGEEVEGEIEDVRTVLKGVQEDVKRGLEELDELLGQHDDRLKEAAVVELQDFKQELADSVEGTPPAVLVESAINAGDRFGEKFPEHVEDVEAELLDLKSELTDVSEFLRTFLGAAKDRASVEQVEEAVSEIPAAEDSLPKQGEDRFPQVKRLNNAGINTYGELLEHRDDFTEIKGIGPAYSEKIRERLAEEGFELSQ